MKFSLKSTILFKTFKFFTLTKRSYLWWKTDAVKMSSDFWEMFRDSSFDSGLFDVDAKIVESFGRKSDNLKN